MKTQNPKAGLPWQARQGDTFHRVIKALPEGAVKTPVTESRLVIEYGELTGHCHAIQKDQATLHMVDDQKFTSISFGQKPELTHDEHDTVVFPTPNQVGEQVFIEHRRQREYDYIEQIERKVRD